MLDITLLTHATNVAVALFAVITAVAFLAILIAAVSFIIDVIRRPYGHLVESTDACPTPKPHEHDIGDA